MLFCAACSIKNCAKVVGAKGDFPLNCPSHLPKMEAYLEKYNDPTDHLLARFSTECSPDHTECRILKTIRFAKMCGYKKIGLAFCITLAEQAREVYQIIKNEGFEVESVVCKVGQLDRTIIGATESSNSMCNPIAQAELLNSAGTELNIILGLCVGHDTLFIRHSKAPVTVLAVKDHVFDNAPLEYLKNKGNQSVFKK